MSHNPDKSSVNPIPRPCAVTVRGVSKAVMPFSTFIFPGGEVNVRFADPRHVLDQSAVYIDANIHSSADLMLLFVATGAIRNINPNVTLHLEIPYFPYARQDRMCMSGEAVGVKVMADLINSQRYRTVTVWDIHNEASLPLIDRVFHRTVDDFLKKINLNKTIICAPDLGAAKKLKGLGIHPEIVAMKQRDSETGELSKPKIITDVFVTDHDILIVDDICDGGRTFINLAELLRSYTKGEVLLYVTHGIFSQGVYALEKYIDHIYVANPFYAVPSDFVTVL